MDVADMSDERSLLLNHLKQFTTPTAFSAISTGLSIPDRTLRRWLSNLVEQGFIKAVGERKGRRYYYVLAEGEELLDPRERVEEDPAEYKTSFETSASDVSSAFSKQSQQVINKVRAPLYERRPCTYRYEWLENYTPNTTFYLAVEERNQLHEIGQRLNVGMPAGTYAKQIFNRLLIDLSYHSSRLEGNTYSLAETEKLLLEGMSAGDKIDADKVMILNHKDAINFLVEGINRIHVNDENIRTMHYLLAEGLVPNGAAGVIRSDGVRITSSTYLPMEGKQRLESQLQLIINKAAAINDPFEQSFFLLIHIAYLQAFIDVNKRTARLSANIPLVRNNLSPLSFIDLDKDDYASAMIACYELNNEKPMVELFIRSYIRSCEHYSVVVEAMGIDTLRVLYRGQRRILISEIVGNLLIGSAIKKRIVDFTKEEIPEEHRQKFMADVEQDLANLEPFNIAGMGISKQDLMDWKEKQ
ncbi:MAG: Fic family protein [Oleispira sp.]